MHNKVLILKVTIEVQNPCDLQNVKLTLIQLLKFT